MTRHKTPKILKNRSKSNLTFLEGEKADAPKDFELKKYICHYCTPFTEFKAAISYKLPQVICPVCGNSLKT